MNTEADEPPRVVDSPRQRLLYLVAAIAQGASSVLVQPFAIRILDPEQWGQVSLMLSLIAVSLVAITAGFPTTLGAFYFDAEDGKSKARSLNGFGSLLSLLLAGAAMIVYSVIAAANGWTDLAPLILVSIAIVGMHGICQNAVAYLRSDQRPGAYVLVIVLATSLGHGAGLLAILVVAPTAIAYLTAFAGCVLAAAVLSMLLSRPTAPFRFPSTLRSAVAIALPVLPHSVAFIALQQGEALLINAFQGPVLVGRYNAVMPFALGAIAIALALSNVWQTVLLSLRGDDPDGQGRRIQNEAFLVGFLLATAGSGVATLATYVLVDRPDAELFALAHLLPIVGYGFVVFIIASTQLFAVRRTRIMSVITPVVAVLAIIVASIPASTGNLLLVGVVKIVSFLLLGLWYTWAANRVRPRMVAVRPMLLWMAAAVTVPTALSLFPTTPGYGVLTAAIAFVIVGATAFWYLRRQRRSHAPSGSADL
ncbi:oligosaccharide flippase family protein [Agromyces mediolanus]|uniref:oligosaccharide flippase family protein n=1 Tax=Agromyces mediolanus TaxID=41986 RepID=UPI001E499D5B|nr:oligosaccharide flippase family protein [Agromyces mediolanus]MCD1571735.1 hypothetical protein [Agromyces mediolanus]